MALYTIVATFRSRQHISQVEETSVMRALRKWAEEFDYSRLPGFGELSKRRLIEATNGNQLGPNEVESLHNVHRWGAAISGFGCTAWIIETAT